MDVLLSPALASAVRDAFRNDSAIDSMVVDLAFASRHDLPVDPAARFVALYRSPNRSRPGDFLVLGGFADPDVANFALLNRRALKPDRPPTFGPDGRHFSDAYVAYMGGPVVAVDSDDVDRSYTGRASLDAWGLDND